MFTTFQVTGIGILYPGSREASRCRTCETIPDISGKNSKTVKTVSEGIHSAQQMPMFLHLRTLGPLPDWCSANHRLASISTLRLRAFLPIKNNPTGMPAIPSTNSPIGNTLLLGLTLSRVITPVISNTTRMKPNKIVPSVVRTLRPQRCGPYMIRESSADKPGMSINWPRITTVW